MSLYYICMAVTSRMLAENQAIILNLSNDAQNSDFFHRSKISEGLCNLDAYYYKPAAANVKTNVTGMHIDNNKVIHP